MRKFKVTIIIIIIVLVFGIRFVLDEHLVPIAQLVAMFNLDLLHTSASQFRSGWLPIFSGFIEYFLFLGFFHYRTVLGYKDQM